MATFSQNGNGKGPVAGCLADAADVLPRFAPVPEAADRAWWGAVDKDIALRLVHEGEAALDSEWLALTASAYRAFTATGDRAGFEAAYFARRRRLNGLALAEAVTGEGRFVEALIDGVWLVCEESGWQLPAHNAHARGGAREPLPDPEKPVVDLFAAETGAQLALLAQLHGDALGPTVVRRVNREIEARIIRPYLDAHFWWMDGQDGKTNNWTAWCTQNILIAAFAGDSDQPTRQLVLNKAAHSLDAFLADYGDDGACEEGAFYYRHAALCLFGALRVMETISPSAFAPIWQEPKIRNMAEFITHAHVEEGFYLNFADASAVLAPCGAREFVFGKAVGSDALCNLAAADARRAPHPELPDEINLWYRLMALATAPEITGYTPRPVQKSDIYYPSCGLFIARDDRFVVAAKAGDNDDGHNHNDVGSVIIYKNGKPLLIDVGVETYTAKTFSPQRYDLWTMQSGFHNLPSFDGVQQQAGKQFAARNVDVLLDTKRSSISMDIAGAYPEQAGVVRYWRTVSLTKGGPVVVEDSCLSARAAELSLMLCEPPEVQPGRIAVGDLGVIALDGAGDIRVEKITVTDVRLRQAWPAAIYRVLIPLNGRELRLQIT